MTRETIREKHPRLAVAVEAGAGVLAVGAFNVLLAGLVLALIIFWIAFVRVGQ